MVEQAFEQFWGPQLGPVVMAMATVFLGCVVFAPIVALVSWAVDRGVERERARR